MDPKQALTILDNASSRTNATRQDHALIIQAIETIKAIIVKNEQLAEDVKDKEVTK